MGLESIVFLNTPLIGIARELSQWPPGAGKWCFLNKLLIGIAKELSSGWGPAPLGHFKDNSKDLW